MGYKVCLHIPQIHLEVILSQVFYLSSSFFFMPKNGKHFARFRKKTFSKLHRIRTMFPLLEYQELPQKTVIDFVYTN